MVTWHCYAWSPKNIFNFHMFSYVMQLGGKNNELVLSEPAGCEVSYCTTYVSITCKKDDDDYVNIYMEGESSTWVAVGFSDSPNMVSSMWSCCGSCEVATLSRGLLLPDTCLL